jgi:hypothetical protein
VDELIASFSEQRARRWLLWSILIRGVAILALLAGAWREIRAAGDE